MRATETMLRISRHVTPDSALIHVMVAVVSVAIAEILLRIIW